jgi:phage shock protein C
MGMSDQPRRLYRSRADRTFLGVCGGLGEFLQVDPTILRLLLVAATFLTGPGVVFAYLIMALIVPLEPLGESTGTVVG